jgi:hypothetical protein
VLPFSYAAPGVHFSQIKSHLHSEHIKQGLVRDRKVRQNHKAAEELLSIPRYANLLAEHAEEDGNERSRALVQSAEGWRVEMGKWIAGAQEAERIEQELNDSEDAASDTVIEPEPLNQQRTRIRALKKWKPLTLAQLFGSTQRPAESRRVRMARRAIEEEEAYMQVMAELDAIDDTVDDGAIEIYDEDVFVP